MEFRLLYRGLLKAQGLGGNREHKHEIRSYFHPQLRELWNHEPLKYYKFPMPPDGIRYVPPKYARNPHKVENFRFVPLVTQDEKLIADLDILLLRPEPPGSVIIQGGDIDNRLKTLFDALRMPKEKAELPDGAEPDDEKEDPFYCLLEDDALITSVSVNTDRLLEKEQDAKMVHLFIHVRIKGTMLTGNNMPLIG